MVKARGSKAKKSRSDGGGLSSSAPPKPYRRIPDSLAIFVEDLDPKHVYVAHIDDQPAAFKRKVFLVPVTMNVAVALLFAWRLMRVGPWYLELLGSAMGNQTSTSVNTADMSYQQVAWILGRRGFTMLLDLLLFIFVWPWPYEFCFGRERGNPVAWRWGVGFRDEEIYVRRSREWAQPLAVGRDGSRSEDGDVLKSAAARSLLLAHIQAATSPQLVREKTGYLTMNGDWDLDFAAMEYAHVLVDHKELALDAFRLLVLLHHDEHGWMVMDTKTTSRDRGASIDDNGPPSPQEQKRRRQVFAFRDALAGLGQEELFYRWIEIIQFEMTQPGGFQSPEKQAAVAQQIRDLFQNKGIDFDELWKESVGSDSEMGLTDL